MHFYYLPDRVIWLDMLFFLPCIAFDLFLLIHRSPILTTESQRVLFLHLK